MSKIGCRKMILVDNEKSKQKLQISGGSSRRLLQMVVVATANCSNGNACKHEGGGH